MCLSIPLNGYWQPYLLCKIKRETCLRTNQLPECLNSKQKSLGSWPFFKKEQRQVGQFLSRSITVYVVSKCVWVNMTECILTATSVRSSKNVFHETSFQQPRLRISDDEKCPWEVESQSCGWKMMFTHNYVRTVRGPHLFAASVGQVKAGGRLWSMSARCAMALSGNPWPYYSADLECMVLLFSLLFFVSGITKFRGRLYVKYSNSSSGI